MINEEGLMIKFISVMTVPSERSFKQLQPGRSFTDVFPVFKKNLLNLRLLRMKKLPRGN